VKEKRNKKKKPNRKKENRARKDCEAFYLHISNLAQRVCRDMEIMDSFPRLEISDTRIVKRPEESIINCSCGKKHCKVCTPDKDCL